MAQLQQVVLTPVPGVGMAYHPLLVTNMAHLRYKVDRIRVAKAPEVNMAFPVRVILVRVALVLDMAVPPAQEPATLEELGLAVLAAERPQRAAGLARPMARGRPLRHLPG